MKNRPFLIIKAPDKERIKFQRQTSKVLQQSTIHHFKSYFLQSRKRDEYKRAQKIRIGYSESEIERVQNKAYLKHQWKQIISSEMEKRNTLDSRFINLRQVFHDFQTSVRFSTSNSPTEIFANQLKSYEFLGQLEEHFIAEKVQYLYEFVHSIFSLIFTMIREGPNQRTEKIDGIKKMMMKDVGMQTDESHPEDKKKLPVEGTGHPYMRHKKRAGLEIQIFEKDLTEMSFRQRRRALQKMRDMIYAQDQLPHEQNPIIKDFKPNIDKISYSKSDQNIKSAIDTFKQSDISTHIFLKHFMEEFVEIKDIKSPSELLSKELIHSMSRAINKYKKVKYQGKGRFRLFSHTIEEVIYPTINEQAYHINIMLSGDGSGEQGAGRVSGRSEKSQKNKKDGDLSMMNEISNLIVPKHKMPQFSTKQKLKRSRFPSLMMRNQQQLNPISQTRSQQSIASSTSSISSKRGSKKPARKKLKSSFSQDEFGSTLNRSSINKNRANSQIPQLLQKNTTDTFNKSRKSFRLDNRKQNLSVMEQEKLKEWIGVKSKKLRKRNISNLVDRTKERPSFRREKGR